MANMFTVEEDDNTAKIKLDGTVIRTYDKSKYNYRLIDSDLAKMEAAATKVQESLARRTTPPANVRYSLYRTTKSGLGQAAFNNMFDKLQEQAIDSYMDNEAKKYEKTFGVLTNAEKYADRKGYGEITQQSDGFFGLSLPGKTPKFASRSAAEKYLARFNELPNEGSAKDYIKQQQQNVALYKASPRPEQTDELAAERESALAAFRANQDLRDYDGGPMSPELKKKQLLIRASANTNTLSPELLRDQTFLRELQNMGVTRLITGGVSSETQEPTFKVLRITPAQGTRDAQGNPLLTTASQASGMDWNSLVSNPTLTDAAANVFWNSTNERGGVTREYDPSVAIGRVSSYSDLSNPNRLGKPSAADFAAITGVSMDQAQFALSPTRNSTGATTDTRNWGAILSSENPYQAALASKYELERQYGSAGGASLKVDPETNELSLTGSATKSYSGANLVGQAGNFAAISLTNNQTGIAKTFIGYLNPRTGYFQQLNTPAQADKFKADLQRLGLGTQGLTELAGQLDANQDTSALDLKRALSTIGEMSPAVPEGSGEAFLHDIPEPLDVALKDSTSVSDAERKKLYNSNFIKFKDVNTGEEKLRYLPKRYTSSGTQRQEALMGMGAIPDYDISTYENLPSDSSDFKRITGRDVAVEDFADYGYNDPQTAYANATTTQQTTSVEEQTRNAFAPTEATFYAPTPATETQQDLPQTQAYEIQSGLNAQNPMTGTFTKTGYTGITGYPQMQQYNTAQPQSQQLQAPQMQSSGPLTPQPVTSYPPQTNMNVGGIVPHMPTPSGGRFGGFKPEAMQRIAQSLGYSGDMSGFDQYLNTNPDKKQRMDNYVQRARQMAEGGAVLKAQSGVDVTGAVNAGNATNVSLQQYDPRVLNQQYIPQQPDLTNKNISQVQADLARTPGLPMGATVVPTGTQLTAGQIVSPYSGQVAGSVALPTALATTEQAMLPTQTQANLMTPIEASNAVTAAADQTRAAQIQQVSGITAAQQQGTSVANVEAAQGTGILMNNPVQRQIQDGELISGAANAETAAKFNEEIQAATATPTKQATVQGQLEGLMAQFDDGQTPAWAAGSMRNAMATLSARGLGASSLAGQAVIQAAMEAALPIAQMDAQVQAQFEQQNLSNRQQRAILAAQQRAQFLGQEFDQAFQARVSNAAKVSDVANMNFTAEQQVALENSRIANTMNLTNLSNSQAMVMAEAAALANMDMANLSNRQQAAVQNAQNFLQADLNNLSNQQQTELFKAQQRVQSLFTDQAALNAAQQFNATSQNQVDQFFASLQNNTAQFNASQANAQAQFNAGQTNVVERFNAEINNQRDQFNAQNRLIIDQSNAQWRREIATADTAAVNRANEVNAQSLLGYSQQAYNNLWQYYADNMEWAWTSAENERQRYMNLTMAKMQQDTSLTLAEMKADYESSAGFGGLIGDILTTDLSNTLAGSIFGGIFK